MNKSTIAYTLKTLGRGLIRTAWGAWTALIIRSTVSTFAVIPTEGGYTAVAGFLCAVALLVLSLVSAYLQGIGSFKKPRSKEVRSWRAV